MDLVPQAVGLPERMVGINLSLSLSVCIHLRPLDLSKSLTMVGAERNDLREE